MTKFVFLADLHYGFERKGGHKIPLHDAKAFDIVMKFCQDFKPDTLVLGGDMLDCGAISRHNHGKPGRVEGMRLLSDAEGCREGYIEPLAQLDVKRKVYIIGNHEDWLGDVEDTLPQ